MKLKKVNKVDEPGAIVAIDFFSITSLSDLRTYLEAARLGLIHAGRSLYDYRDLLKCYETRLNEYIKASEIGQEFKNSNYLRQTCKIISQARQAATRADDTNFLTEIPPIGLGMAEDAFKQTVIFRWFAYAREGSPPFDAKEIMDEFKSRRPISEAVETNSWLFVGFFSNLKAGLQPGELAILHGATDSKFAREVLIPKLKHYLDGLKDDSRADPKLSRKPVEHLRGEDEFERIGEDDEYDYDNDQKNDGMDDQDDDQY